METIIILVVISLIVLYAVLARRARREEPSGVDGRSPRRIQSRGNSRPIVIQKAAVQQAQQLAKLKKDLLQMRKLTGRPSSWKGHEPPDYYSDWEEMPDYIYGYSISGVMDDDCCNMCRPLDGKGIYHIDVLRFFKPPFCKECRCNLTPIIKDEVVGGRLPYPALDLDAVCDRGQGDLGR